MAEPETLAARLIFEDARFHVSHPLAEEGKRYRGLALVQTKRHARDLSELNRDEAREPGPVLGRLSRVIERVTGASWTYCYSFLEGSRHLHVLLTARYPNLPPEYVRLDVAKWPDAPVGGPVEVAELCQQLRAAWAVDPA
ncbi:MAG: hypothetical protein ACREDE_09580 [Thermoplasmata archaeon]